MTIGNAQTGIYRRTHTNVNNFTDANMALAMNTWNRKAHAIIRKFLDNFRPTDWTTSVLTTGSVSPIFDALYHSYIELGVSYDYGKENGFPKTITDGWLGEIKELEKGLAYFYSRRNYQIFTVTIASPAVFTKDDHGLSVGDRVSFITSDADLPTSLSVDTVYYVISDGLTSHEFQLATTRTGSAINTSGSQTGTHWYFALKQPRLIPGDFTKGDSNK